jgi:hypothetical protein
MTVTVFKKLNFNLLRWQFLFHHAYKLLPSTGISKTMSALAQVQCSSDFKKTILWNSLQGVASLREGTVEGVLELEFNQDFRSKT